MTTVGLLILSNLFMTAAWYGHLRFRGTSLWKVIVASWASRALRPPVTE